MSADLDRLTRTPANLRSTATIIAAVMLAVGILAAAAFWTTGGRWFVVRTPSMGTAAPVGTLVLTRPTSVASLHVGDVVAFHPPGARQETYTHRVVSIAGGHMRTRGDINGIADPWVLGDKDLVGRATVIVPRLGWLARAAPLLIVGGLLLWLVTHYFFGRASRGPARMLGAALLFALAAVRLKPFLAVVQLANTSDGNTSRITVVSTGLLPVRLAPAPGHGHAAPVDLSTGQLGVSVLHGVPRGGHFQLASHLHLHWTQWIIAITLSLLPLLWTLIVGYSPVPQPQHRAADRSVAA